jgi:hypothetical protein
MRLAELAAFACTLSLGACASAPAAVFPTVHVPDDAARSGWAEARIHEGVPQVFRALAEGGSGAMRAMRLRPAEVAELFTDAGRQRIERSVPGLTPSPRERRWQVLSLHRADAVVGWCARGVHVAESGGAEGFRARTLYVERLLIVGAEGDGRWGAWIEGLVLTGNGWRMLPWVPYEDAVEAPRSEHTDLALWDCDLARRGW